MYKGNDPVLVKLYNQLEKLQKAWSFSIMNWNETKLTNLKTWLDNTDSTVSDFLKLKSDKKWKIGKGEVSGIKQTEDFGKHLEGRKARAFRSWLDAQDATTTKAKDLHDLMRQSKTGVDRDAAGRIIEEPKYAEKFGNIKKGSKPILYQKKFTKHMGGGLYKETSIRGNETYFGKIIRKKKPIKQGFGEDIEAAKDWLEKKKKLPLGKNVIVLQSEKGTLLEQPKYKKALANALDDLAKMETKGYGAINEIVKKYQNIFSKVGETSIQGKIIEKGATTESRAIASAIRSYAAENNIRDVKVKNMEKALDEYLAKKTINRGDLPKLIRKHGIPQATFQSWLDDLDVRRIIPLKHTSLTESREAAKIKRAAALKKYSSSAFENWTKGTKDIHGGHTGQIYSEYVTPETKRFTPKWINQETLKSYDAILQAISKKRDAAFKAKNWVELERLNQSGMNIAAATEGYKTFTVKNRDGSTWVSGKTGKGSVDPAGLIKKGTTAQEMESWHQGENPVMRQARADFKKGIITKAELSALNEAEAQKLFAEGKNKALLDFQKEGAIKSAKLSPPEIMATDKRLLAKLADLQTWYKKAGKTEKTTIQIILGCRNPAASGGRIGFASGNLDACVNTKLTNEPVQSSMKLRVAEGVGKIRPAATTFLSMLGRGGLKAAPYAAIAAIGAAAEPLVKQFRNDDPSTYLSNPEQQKGMLLSMIEAETPKVDEEILKWQYPGEIGATAAGAIPGAKTLFQERRGVGPRGPLPEGVGKTRAALGIKGVLGKALGASFSPLAVAATLPISVAAQRKGGSDWGDIATDPGNWMGPAFMSSGYNLASKGIVNPTLLKLLRFGISRGALAAMGPVGWAGLAGSLGLAGYDMWKNRDKDDEFKMRRYEDDD